MALYTGIRIGEICALKWKDINFKNNTIIINKTLQRIYIKEQNKNTSKIIISSPKTKYLLNIKTDDNDYIIKGTIKYIETRSYRTYFNKLLNKLNIRKVNFHVLRHTFATNCIIAGIDCKTVSELLGHSSVNITLNLYVHPKIEEKMKCINIISKNLI